MNIKIISKILITYTQQNKFISKQKNILITGNINNILIPSLPNIKIKIHTQDLCILKNQKKNDVNKIIFSLLIKKEIINSSEILIYIWTKSKHEVLFQLNYIFSLLNSNQKIFILGENKSGIKCAKKILKKWIILTKLHSINHYTVYIGKIFCTPRFEYYNFIKHHEWNNIIVKTIPGVFSYNKIDNGTKLLISTFNNTETWKTALDIGCGSGILSVFLAKNYPKIKLTLLDSHISALESSKLTLKFNNIQARILASDIYSNINYKKFDLIISNPPLHQGNKINFNTLKNIIQQSVEHLSKRGEIRIVTLKNTPCYKIFKLFFFKINVLKETTCYKVYQVKKKDYIVSFKKKYIKTTK